MAWSSAGFQQLIDGDVQCDDEVVEEDVPSSVELRWRPR
jgi:hypothetical protein